MLTRSRSSVAVAAAALAVAAVAAVSPAAEAPVPRPVVTLTAQVSPSRLPIPPGTPMTLSVHTAFSSEPAGGSFVLQRAEYSFGRGARFNGALFPSCSVAKLLGARGRLSACPKGSRVGHGIATGRAVAIGATGTGRITVFNGPRGRSLVFNVAVVTPALINATFEAPIVWLHRGRYEFKLATAVPPELQAVLDGDVVVQRLDVTTGATLTIHGRRRGYFEAATCPRHGSAIHGDFTFNQGVSATADLKVVC